MGELGKLRPVVLSALVLMAGWGLSGCGGPEPAPTSGDWRETVKSVRMTMQGDQADPTRARRRKGYEAYIQKALGVPVEVFEATDYNGVVQGLASGQVDMGQMGSGSYANVDAQVGDKVAPMFVIRQAEGNMGYYGAILVRADSPYRTLSDLKGKTLAYVDFNSTSGYLVPRYSMRQEGIEPDTFFGKSVMAGGATQAALALVNGQVDAAVINVSGGTPETGFSTGSHYSLSRKGLINLEDVRLIWVSQLIPNSPVVVRADRPQDYLDTFRGALVALPYDDPQLWADIGQAEGGNFAPVDRSFFESVIEIRKQDIALRRGMAGGDTGGARE